MLKLVIAGEKDSTPTVAFRLVQGGDDIDVYADGILVGWFQTNGDDKIVFSSAGISRLRTDKFALDAKGQLATV